MKNRWMAAALCFCFCVGMTACGQEKAAENNEEVVVETENAVSVSNGTLSDDSTAIAVGETAVSYAEYKVYNYFMKSRYESLLGTQIWDYSSGDDGTIGEEATLDVLRLIIQVKVINKAAAYQNITLAADEKEAADSNATEFCNSLSEEVKSANGISQSLVAKIFEENRLASKMYNIVVGEVDVSIADEQCQAARVQLIYLKADDSNREQVRQDAAQMLEKAKAATSFYALAKENSQADEPEYLIGKQDARTNLVTAVLALKTNEISQVIEESDGFYIAYCVSKDSKAIRKEYKNQVIEERQNKAFSDAYRQWSESYDVKVSKSLLKKDEIGENNEAQ